MVGADQSRERIVSLRVALPEIDGLALEGVKAIERGELEQLGELMNINQGLLNALGCRVGSREMIQIPRRIRCFRCETYRRWWRWLDSRGMPHEEERIVTELCGRLSAIATTSTEVVRS